ncbi:MAG: hypothetical protein WD099_01160 [Dongiaceae bacterium]
MDHGDHALSRPRTAVRPTAAGTRKSGLRAGLGNILVALASLVVMLAFGEMGLRFYFYGELGQPRFGVDYFAPDEKRGWGLKPSTMGRHQDLDYNIPVAINSKGLREPERTYERVPGKFRILLVSDSATFASGVTVEQSPPALLERALGPERTEVVNLSVPAYNNVQEYLLLVEEGMKYRPDLVLLGFAPSNDIQGNYQPLAEMYKKNLRRPYARLDATDRSIVIDFQHAERAAARMQQAEAEAGGVADFFENTVVYHLIKTAVRRLGTDVRDDPNVFIGRPFLAGFAPEYGTRGFAEADYARVWQEGWEVTAALIKAMRAEAEKAGGAFAIYIAPPKIQGDRSYRERVQEAFPGLRFDMTRINREIAAFGSANGIPVIDVLPALEAADRAGPPGRLYYDIEDEHLRPEGHAVVVAELARRLRDLGLVAAR